APPQHPRLVQAVSIRRLAAIAAMKYPLVTLQSLNLNVRRFSISDASRPASKPLVLSNLRLRNTKPIQLLGNDPPSRPPVQLELTGAVQPLADSITADINASPFADEPGFGVYLTVTGIHGQGITDLVPELRDRIDGSPLTDGRLQSHFGAAIFLPPHNDPLQFDLSHGFKMDAGIKGTRFTLGPNGPVLAGIGEISLDEIRVEPHRGVEIKDVEVDDISANVYRDQRGIYALGMLLKSSPPPAAQSSAAHAINPPRVATPPPTPPSTPIRLDDVLVSGLNFNYVDKTCNPPLVVPLNQLDLEIHSFSNMMRFEDRPCRFSLLVGAASKPNQSPLFSQIESSGNFSLYPHPSGWVKSSISGVDLSQLRGPAAQAGITLAGGTFDGSADAYLNGKIINTHCALSVTDLSVAEPPNGPIQRELKLNVPLNVAIGVLEDPSKAISIGIDLALSTDQMTFAAIESQVDSQVPSAVAQVIGTAIASAPAKVALAFLPIGGSSPDNRPIVIHFSPGDTSLSAADLQRLEPLIRRMRSDDSLVVTLTHSLSPADLARAQTLANPSYQDSLNLAYRLHTQEMSLLTQRAQAAQRASAELASGFGPDADPALQQVRQIDQTLETTEDALDEVYDLLRPGAERWAARRTRRAALEIGRDRLKAIQDAILAGSTRKANLDPRVKVFSPSFNAARGAADGSVTITLNYKKT
ncbi:MAG TPA: hypothetical protein VMD30_08930, partial [Tepidisphaeraceae bacterium]|nr:hypothetical protein [Tepidisphaeraceae bacterium]